MSVSIIAAIAANGVIGIDGKLPWRLPKDLAHFKRTTMGKPIIMGRRTWNSLNGPLPGRTNIVLTSNPAPTAHAVTFVGSFKEAMANGNDDSEYFVIGGSALFRETLPIAQRLHITWVHAEVPGDTFFPAIDLAQWRQMSCQYVSDSQHCCPFSICAYERIILPSADGRAAQTAPLQATIHNT